MFGCCLTFVLEFVTVTTVASLYFRWATVVSRTTNDATNGPKYDGHVCLRNDGNDDGPEHVNAILLAI